MKHLSALILFVLLITTARAQQPITTVILVRHAEKASDGTKDPDLSPEGMKRAEALVALLRETPVTAIYTTNYKRTRNTVMPLATAKNHTPEVYDPSNPAELDRILVAHPGETIVIVGHSNTIPAMANALTGTRQFSDWKDSDYDNVLIVSVVEKGKTASVTWLTYGVATQ